SQPLVTLLRPRQATRQVTGQRHPQVRVRPQADIVDVLPSAAAFQLLKKAVQLVQVAVAQRPRIGEQLRFLLQAAEQGRLLEREIKLSRIQDMEQDHLMPAIAQVLQPLEKIVHVVKTIAKQNNQPAAVDALGQVVEER